MARRRPRFSGPKRGWSWPGKGTGSPRDVTSRGLPRADRPRLRGATAGGGLRRPLGRGGALLLEVRVARRAPQAWSLCLANQSPVWPAAGRGGAGGQLPASAGPGSAARCSPRRPGPLRPLSSDAFRLLKAAVQEIISRSLSTCFCLGAMGLIIVFCFLFVRRKECRYFVGWF